eukprot:5019583-Amphidinium_carterae.1
MNKIKTHEQAWNELAVDPIAWLPPKLRLFSFVVGWQPSCGSCGQIATVRARQEVFGPSSPKNKNQDKTNPGNANP